ncbi:MAG: hypothetical protein ACREPD_06205 [Stenotrophomonas sp.]|uniref:hypothetical protein n=1 Tax=Stenotrophomonas sp. TaxID=69392 RepID=UPI003D6C8425
MNRHPRQNYLPNDFFLAPKPIAQTAGSMDYRQIVSVMVGQMLESAHAAGLDRYEVAARASRLTGQHISKAMLDGYTAPSRQTFNIPLWIAPVLQVVCGCSELAEWQAENIGGQLLLGADTLDAEIGRMERQRIGANKRLRALRNLSERSA